MDETPIFNSVFNNRTNQGQHIMEDSTPNVVIKNPDVRKWMGAILYTLSILTGIAAYALSVFPELNFGDDVLGRMILVINGTISIISASFGFAITIPNIPSRK